MPEQITPSPAPTNQTEANPIVAVGYTPLPPHLESAIKTPVGLERTSPDRAAELLNMGLAPNANPLKNPKISDNLGFTPEELQVILAPTPARKSYRTQQQSVSLPVEPVPEVIIREMQGLTDEETAIAMHKFRNLQGPKDSLDAIDTMLSELKRIRRLHITPAAPTSVPTPVTPPLAQLQPAQPPVEPPAEEQGEPTAPETEDVSIATHRDESGNLVVEKVRVRKGPRAKPVVQVPKDTEPPLGPKITQPDATLQPPSPETVDQSSPTISPTTLPVIGAPPTVTPKTFPAEPPTPQANTATPPLSTSTIPAPITEKSLEQHPERPTDKPGVDPEVYKYFDERDGRWYARNSDIETFVKDGAIVTLDSSGDGDVVLYTKKDFDILLKDRITDADLTPLHRTLIENHNSKYPDSPMALESVRRYMAEINRRWGKLRSVMPGLSDILPEEPTEAAALATMPVPEPSEEPNLTQQRIDQAFNALKLHESSIQPKDEAARLEHGTKIREHVYELISLISSDDSPDLDITRKEVLFYLLSGETTRSILLNRFPGREQIAADVKQLEDADLNTALDYFNRELLREKSHKITDSSFRKAFLRYILESYDPVEIVHAIAGITDESRSFWENLSEPFRTPSKLTTTQVTPAQAESPAVVPAPEPSRAVKFEDLPYSDLTLDPSQPLIDQLKEAMSADPKRQMPLNQKLIGQFLPQVISEVLQTSVAKKYISGLAPFTPTITMDSRSTSIEFEADTTLDLTPVYSAMSLGKTKPVHIKGALLLSHTGEPRIYIDKLEVSKLGALSIPFDTQKVKIRDDIFAKDANTFIVQALQRNNVTVTNSRLEMGLGSAVLFLESKPVSS